MAVSTEHVAFDSLEKWQAAEKKLEGLWTALQDAETALANHLGTLNESTALVDTARSKL